MTRTAVWGVCVLLATAGHGQGELLIDARRYGPEEGLSHRQVNAVLQDQVGFIWAGTASGLDRFDGHQFQHWTRNEGLSSGHIDFIRQDASGTIWAMSRLTRGGLRSIDLLDPLTGMVTPLGQRFRDRLPFEVRDIVHVAPQTNDRTLCFGTSAPARCILYDPTKGFRVFPVEGAERFEPYGFSPMGLVLGRAVDRAGRERLVQLDRDGQVTWAKEWPEGSEMMGVATGRTAPGAFYRVRNAAGEWTHYDTFSEMPVGAPGALLHYTPLRNGGLVAEDHRVLDRRGKVLHDVSERFPEIAYKLNDGALDNRGRLWLATDFGLYRVEVRTNPFQRLLYSEHIPEGYGVRCRGMARVGDLLVVNTEITGQFDLSQRHGSTLGRCCEGEYLYGVALDAHGRRWSGSTNTLLAREPDGSQRRFPVEDHIWSILPEFEGGLLLGGEHGLWWFDPASGTQHRYGDPAHPELDGAHVAQILRGYSGEVWATTSQGMYRIIERKGITERFWAGGEGGNRLPFDDLHHCHMEHEGLFWLSTRGGGLLRWDRKTGKTEQFSRREGFPDNMVYAAYDDGDGHLWLPSDAGIIRFDKTSRQSCVFTVEDGITHNEFNRLAHHQAPDGRLFFGGLNGITAFHPKDIRMVDGTNIPPMLVTGFHRYSTEHGRMVDRTAEVIGADRITLRPEDRSFRLSFALLSFDPPERTTYAWRLTGVQDEWTYQQEPSIRMDRLPYGTHTLHVKGRNALGEWNVRELTLDIEVLSPWYFQRWAMGLAVLLVLGSPLLWLAFRPRRKVAVVRELPVEQRAAA